MPLTNLRVNGLREQLVPSAARTTNSDTGALGGYGPMTQGVVQLNVTAIAGTTPTLDVKVEDSVDGTNWNSVQAFTQVTAAGRLVLRITAPFSDLLRVSWTIGGTAGPSFTFDVWAYFETGSQPVQG